MIVRRDVLGALSVLNVAYPPAPVGPDAVGGAEQIWSAIDRDKARELAHARCLLVPSLVAETNSLVAPGGP